MTNAATTKPIRAMVHFNSLGVLARLIGWYHEDLRIRIEWARPLAPLLLRSSV
jgi:hypothetical protein